ncbi:MAG TPA: GGDEF domain-containing protein [Gammaproteobacteria bacterium]|nr:GGDEF domain-containing protein [Gammaproteobacteria bacterium]
MLLFPLLRLMVPLLMLPAVWLLREPLLRPAYRPLLDLLPYAGLMLAMALCLFYNRARLFTLALALLTAYWLIDAQLQSRLGEARPLFVYCMLVIALPSTGLLLLALPERGLRNRYGLALVLTVPMQLCAGWLLWNYFPDTAAVLTHALPVQPFGGRYYLPHTAAGLFLLNAVAGLYVLCRYDSEHAAALLGALLFAFVTFAFFREARISAVMLGAAGLALVISLVRSSYDMAYYDDLTGLRGRRALNEGLRGLGGRYTLAMLDVDHFKRFNDDYGHEAGDEVLRMVAKRIARVRGGGKAYRYGGEEFCIVFAGRQLEQCLPHLEDLRAAVEDYEMSLRDRGTRPRSKKAGRRQRGMHAAPRTVSVTVSVGAAENDERHDSFEQVLQAADAALYKAKRKGRNCVFY